MAANSEKKKPQTPIGALYFAVAQAIASGMTESEVRKAVESELNIARGS